MKSSFYKAWADQRGMKNMRLGLRPGVDCGRRISTALATAKGNEGHDRGADAPGPKLARASAEAPRRQLA